MKEKRQRAILDIIANHIIETQEQLLAELKERGFRCTQATISRDMKELQLIKELTPTGSYRYAVSIHQNRRDFNDRLRNVFREGVTSVDLAQNIIVLKTMPGLANAAAAALDGMDIEEMVGSLAGDDTALLVMRNTHQGNHAAQHHADRQSNCRYIQRGDDPFEVLLPAV